MKTLVKAFLVFSQVFLISSCFNLNAQIIFGYSNDSLNEFHFRVKQFSEFSDRFNFNTDHKGEEINDKTPSALTRNILISTLFNQNDSRFNSESKDFSQEYFDLAKNFVKEVCEKDLYLDKHSENIYARAICTGSYHNRKVDFSIILQQERVGKDMLKWVVKDIESEFLEFLEEDSIMLRFLPPSADELDFMELRRALSDSTHLDGYSSRDFKYEPLSVFYFLLNKGEVKLENILEVEYIIRDIPAYEFILKDFNRHSNNSGWLISDLRRLKP